MQSLKARFTTQHDGYPAAVFDNSVAFNNFTLTLKAQGISFTTKIRKAKRTRGRELIVMLVANGT